jgi:ubiquinone biosynthesis protein COQ9
MKNEIKLSDLKQHDSMYFIGDLYPYRDGDGWVFEDEAVAFVKEWNEQQAINLIINTIRENEFNGETIYNILEELGMKWQTMRQLMLHSPMEQVEYLVEEKKSLKLNM